jgi:haloalkane dehalogenase
VSAAAAAEPLRALPPELAALYPFRSRRLALEAGRMHYLDEGPPEAEPLLCVHGNPTWSFYWRGVVQAFRRTRRVVVPDHLGCGLSDRPREFGWRLVDHVEALERLVLALDLRRITLVLHDWGGPIGLGFARRRPERVARLVLTNTAAFPVRRVPFALRVARAPGLGALLVRGLGLFSGLAPRLASARGLEPLVRRGLRAPYSSWDERLAVHRFVRDIPVGPGHPSWEELLAIEAALPGLADRPTLLVWGERDWVFTPALRDELRRRLPAAELVSLPDAGHLVAEDAPLELERALREFLARHPLAAAGAGAEADAP